MSVSYLRRLMDGVTPEHFARLPGRDETRFKSNHPAFIMGHLSLYPCRIVSDLAGDASSIQPSEKYQALFSPSATCLDDPEGTLYPAMDEIVQKCHAAHELAIETLSGASDDAFDRPNPNERMRSRFATLGSMHAFYMGGHIMIHVGQFSTWRRVMGYGPA
ncbi:MAG: DinB family protein [Planctomycetota bacterium]